MLKMSKPKSKMIWKIFKFNTRVKHRYFTNWHGKGSPAN